MISAMYNRFYVLRPMPVSNMMRSGMVAVRADPAVYGDAPRCPTCHQYIGSRKWLPPHRISVEVWDQCFPDLLLMNTDILVSDRFKSHWISGAFIGLSDYAPVEVDRVNWRTGSRGRLPLYFHAKVARSRAAIDMVASGFEWDEPPSCEECRLGRNVQRWQRILIEENTWDGLDVFFARGIAGTIIVTERLKAMCEREYLRAPVFAPAETFAYDFRHPSH